jgi:hypothetical protein
MSGTLLLEAEHGLELAAALTHSLDSMEELVRVVLASSSSCRQGTYYTPSWIHREFLDDFCSPLDQGGGCGGSEGESLLVSFWRVHWRVGAIGFMD